MSNVQVVSDSLYSIKWYRDDQEFFRFIPQVIMMMMMMMIVVMMMMVMMMMMVVMMMMSPGEASLHDLPAGGDLGV